MRNVGGRTSQKSLIILKQIIKFSLIESVFWEEVKAVWWLLLPWNKRAEEQANLMENIMKICRKGPANNWWEGELGKGRGEGLACTFQNM